AFTAMRARGARVTDIVVLVCAADDPIMPQTVEAINHAREANVPIIVAINKIDLPTANVNRITGDLMAQGLVPETQGGETIFALVSAKKRIGINELLESILLQAEIMELKANPKRRGVGVIIESRNDPQRGAVSTVLVQKGTLHIGDAFVVGQIAGRIKAMFDEHGQPKAEADPSEPVEILGMDGVPDAGEVFLVMPDERRAREIAEIRANRRRVRGMEQRQHVTLEGLKDMIDREKIKELRIILKAGVQGSLEAVRQSLERITHEEIKVRILHGGVGAVTEGDVDLADASDAIIVGFQVRADAAAADQAQRRGIEIRTYEIIYDLIDEVKAAMAGMLEKKYKEIPRGRAEVRQVFKVSKFGNVAGCYVTSGEIGRNARARLLRDDVVIYNGRVANLRRYKDDVSSVPVGQECGIGLENYHDIHEGDEIEVYELEEIPVHL
ncbi:MAG: translation initiation factor IF-2, partial [Candidatus Sumerlaeota bacterium]|nr:translation initiation factor IF-2 [Candidatus Sumerlaeota bacterium]